MIVHEKERGMKKGIKVDLRIGRCVSGSCVQNNALMYTAAKDGPLRFVIHKHQSKRIHYDMRIFHDDVLVSWALPKGPSINPEVKRLAIRTVDHDRHYEQFEGVIPEGEYGAGVVMIWDRGVYFNIKMHAGEPVPFDVCLKEGHLELFFKGTKIYGAFSLVRMSGDDNNWLLIKMRDQYAAMADITRSVKAACSVLTGRTMAQIKKDSET